MGAWFEAQIVKVTTEASPTTDRACSSTSSEPEPVEYYHVKFDEYVSQYRKAQTFSKQLLLRRKISVIEVKKYFCDCTPLQLLVDLFDIFCLSATMKRRLLN